MPWDSAAAPAPTPPINANRPPPQASSSSNATATVSSANGEVHIKREPPPEFEPNGYSNQAALQRAGQALHEKFGSAASQQVNQLQARAEMAAKREPGMPTPPAPAAPAPAAAQMTPEQQRAYQERIMAQARAQQQQNIQNQKNLQNLQQAQRRSTPVSNAQTDGPSDWNDMVMQRRANAAGASSHEADVSIRELVEQGGLEMEGGGLMMPLAQQKKPRALARLRAAQKNASGDGTAAEASSSGAPSSAIAQADGPPGDDANEELDEDAINSDLDDPEDDAIEEADDDQTMELMLCTYDKVQRVKNKWKCTLKDGVLTTGNKEYVDSSSVALRRLHYTVQVPLPQSSG